MRCLWLLWSLLTWVAAILCTVGCLLPYWLKGYVSLPTATPYQPSTDPHTGHYYRSSRPEPETKVGVPTDLGLFRRCGYPVYINQTSVMATHQTNRQYRIPVKWERVCGHYSHLTNVPHTAWRVAFVFLVTACVLLFFVTFFLFILGFAIYLLSVQGVYRSCQAILLTSGLLTLMACVLYPIGWNDNSEIRQACGEEANTLNLGRCQVGWAYVLTCSGGLLSLFSATLPIIFPKHSTDIGSVYRSQQGRKFPVYSSYQRGTSLCCCPQLDAAQESIPVDRLDFLPLYQPSSANSLDTQSLVYQPSLNHRPGSMLFVTRSDGLSPTGSSSPVASVTNHHFDAAGKGSENVGSKAQSTVSLHKTMKPSLVPKAPIMPPYSYVCNYVPQRYSTGALFSHFHPMNAMHLSNQTNQRVSVTVNTDPLIYVAEEDEVDASDSVQPDADDSAANHHPVGEKPAANTEQGCQTTQTNDLGKAKQDASVPHLSYRTQTKSVPDFQRVIVSPAVMPANPALHNMVTVSIPGIHWLPPCPYGLLVNHTSGRSLRPSGAHSETIRRKRASCML